MSQGILGPFETKDAEVAASGACIGRVIRVDANGQVFVDFRDNQQGPIGARVATAGELIAAGQPVLLLFEEGNPSLPVVAGVVRENLHQQEPKSSLRLEAANEITIVCGKSSITLRKDGRILLRGTELVSRASGSNKIRGATVQIN